MDILLYIWVYKCIMLQTLLEFVGSEKVLRNMKPKMVEPFKYLGSIHINWAPLFTHLVENLFLNLEVRSGLHIAPHLSLDQFLLQLLSWLFYFLACQRANVSQTLAIKVWVAAFPQPGSQSKIQNLRQQIRHSESDVFHLNKNPRKCMCTLKVEKYYLKQSPLSILDI